jgi:flavin-binding protein dodecin
MTILKSSQILSDSTQSFEDAVANGVERFAKTVNHVRSASVNHLSVTVEDGKIDKYRVNMQVTFEVK